jgi:MFS family permease
MSTAPPGLDSARAWGVTAASFIAMLTTFGVAYSFGAFLVPMSTDLGSGRATTSAVFSLTTLILFGFGALSGAIVDRVGPRPVLLFGAVFFGGGLVITARADSLWQAFLGHAVGVGLGVACSYVPLVAVVGGWFERRRTLAVGVAVSGIGLGTLLVAPLSAALISSLGWRDAYLVLAAVGTAVLLVCAVFVLPVPVHPDALPIPALLPRLRSARYVWLYVGQLLLSVMLFVPFVHLPAYASSHGTGDVAAAALVGLIGAASVLGRLAPGSVAQRVGVLRTYQGCFVLMAVSFACGWVHPAIRGSHCSRCCWASATAGSSPSGHRWWLSCSGCAGSAVCSACSTPRRLWAPRSAPRSRARSSSPPEATSW